MPTIYHAAGPGARLGEVIGADGDIRSQLAGDVHLVSLDGKYFCPFSRRPQPGDYATIQELLEDRNRRLFEFARGVVERALGEVEEVAV